MLFSGRLAAEHQAYRVGLVALVAFVAFVELLDIGQVDDYQKAESSYLKFYKTEPTECLE